MLAAVLQIHGTPGIPESLMLSPAASFIPGLRVCHSFMMQPATIPLLNLNAPLLAELSKAASKQ